MSLNENWLMNIFKDSNDNMWLASYGGGLNKYSPLTSLIHHGLTAKGNTSFRVESFAETSDGSIWISTEKQGLFKVNKNKQIEKIEVSLKENIRQVLAGKDNKLWFYTENDRLYSYTLNSAKLAEHKKWHKEANYSVTKEITIIGNNLWYINNNTSLITYNTKTQNFVNYVIPGSVTIKNIQKGVDDN